MKVTPITGTGVPAASSQSIGSSVSSESKARAIAVASGEEPKETPQSSGDPQVDRINTKRIKMKTQVSTNRDDVNVSQETVQAEPAPEAKVPMADANEEAQGTEETRPLSPQFAALAKAKRAIQVKEMELAKREEALKSSAPAGQEDVIAKLKADPLSVLQEAGVTYDQLTEAILNSQSTPISPKDIDALVEKKLNERLEKEFGTRDSLAEKQVLMDLRRETDAITANGDQYEAVREAKAQHEVVELIHRTWKETGEILDVSEAAQLVEEQLIQDALPFAKIKKLQSRLNPTPEPIPAAQTPAVPKPNTKVMRTLTNRDTASPLMDKRARAIAAMQGTLKKG